MIIRERRAVAPVIATLLMVAIAVVGGMLVFVFAQDFFTSTDTMTGPTIEVLHLYGYDARDLGDAAIENHAGDTCTVNGAAGGTLADLDVFAIYVRNLGSNDVVLSDVSVFNVKGSPVLGALAIGDGNPGDGIQWLVNVGATCTTEVSASGTPIPAGRDATILIAYGTGTDEFGEPVKLGRPVFVRVETGSGNVFTKQIVNGRQIG